MDNNYAGAQDLTYQVEVFFDDDDGIANWNDEDSDGDSFSDFIEGIEDLNKDYFPNYLDRDADGNSIDDKIESGDSSQPNDFDRDSLIDHLDLDDDGDSILDNFDSERLKKATRITMIEDNSLTLYSLNNIENPTLDVKDLSFVCADYYCVFYKWFCASNVLC